MQDLLTSLFRTRSAGPSLVPQGATNEGLFADARLNARSMHKILGGLRVRMA